MLGTYPDVAVFTITLASRTYNYKIYTREGSPMLQGDSIVQIKPPWYEIITLDRYGTFYKEWGTVTVDDQEQIKFISSNKKEFGKGEHWKMIDYMQSLLGLPVITYEQLKLAVSNLV